MLHLLIPPELQSQKAISASAVTILPNDSSFVFSHDDSHLKSFSLSTRKHKNNHTVILSQYKIQSKKRSVELNAIDTAMRQRNSNLMRESAILL